MKPTGSGRVVRVLKWIGIGLLAAVLVFVAFRVGGNALNARRAQTDADAAYAAALPVARDWVQEMRDAFGPEWGEPIGERETLACEVDTVEGGWWIMDYSHSCLLRETLVFRATDGVDAAHAVVEASALPREDVLEPSQPAVGSCVGLFRGRDGDARVDIDWVPAGEAADPDSWCAAEMDPEPTEGRFGRDKKVRETGDIDRALVAEADSVLLVREERISFSRLGCSVFPPAIFCEEPVGTRAYLPAERP